MVDVGQATESGVASAVVVGALGEGHDRDPEVVALGSRLAVQDVLLQERDLETLVKDLVAGVPPGG